MTTRGAFEHRRMVLEKAPFAGGAEAADRACAPATDWQPMQRSAAPRNAGRVGRDCLGLVCVAPAASSRHLPSLFLHRLLQAWPSPCKRFLAQDACRGDRICSLRSGVGRAFPTLRVWEAAPERGAVAARAWTCPCGLGTWPGDEARLPGSAPASSSIHYEERNGSHATLLNFTSLFLCRGQRVQ